MKSLVNLLRSLYFGILIVIVATYPTQDADYNIHNGTKNNVNPQLSGYRRQGGVYAPPCNLNQYYDKEEGRCLGIPGGGKIIRINRARSCGTNILKPHCSNSRYYYVCKKNKMILAQCANGQHFENRLKHCVYVDPITLNQGAIQLDEEYYDDIKLPVCQKPGRFPIDEYCFLFYTCETNGHRLYQNVFKCPENMGYEAESDSCTSIPNCENKESFTSSICVSDTLEDNDQEMGITETTQNQEFIGEKPTESNLGDSTVAPTDSNFKISTLAGSSQINYDSTETTLINDENITESLSTSINFSTEQSVTELIDTTELTSSTSFDESTTLEHEKSLGDFITQITTEMPVSYTLDTVSAPFTETFSTTLNPFEKTELKRTIEFSTPDPLSQISDTPENFQFLKEYIKNIQENCAMFLQHSSTNTEKSTLNKRSTEFIAKKIVTKTFDDVEKTGKPDLETHVSPMTNVNPIEPSTTQESITIFSENILKTDLTSTDVLPTVRSETSTVNRGKLPTDYFDSYVTTETTEESIQSSDIIINKSSTSSELEGTTVTQTSFIRTGSEVVITTESFDRTDSVTEPTQTFTSWSTIHDVSRSLPTRDTLQEDL